MTSIQPTQFCLLAQSNSVMNNFLYMLVSSISVEEQKRTLGAFFGSIYDTLSHLLLSDRVWLGRFATSTKYKFPALDNTKLVFEFEPLSDILYPDFSEI